MAQVGRGRAPQLGENQRDIRMRELIRRERERERVLHQSSSSTNIQLSLYLLFVLLHIPECILISIHQEELVLVKLYMAANVEVLSLVVEGWIRLRCLRLGNATTHEELPTNNT